MLKSVCNLCVLILAGLCFAAPLATAQDFMPQPLMNPQQLWTVIEEDRSGVIPPVGTCRPLGICRRSR